MRHLVLLFTMMPAIALAAVPTVTVTGKVLTPSGVPPTSGTVTARLSQPGSVLDGSVYVRVAADLAVGAIGPDGSVSLQLVPNDAIVPSGTAYLVTFEGYLRNGRKTSWQETWQLASDPSPIDVGSVPRLGVVPGVAVVSAPAVAQAAADAQASATASAAAASSSATAAASSASAAAGSASAAEAAKTAIESGTATIVPSGETTARALKDTLTHVVTPGAAGGRNVVANPQVNSIAADVQTSTIAGGGSTGFPQRIGSTTDTGASFATIGGGYDNTNDQLAGTIAGGAHHVLDPANGADHSTIGGGSWNKVDSTGKYNTIAGGTANLVTGAAGRAVIAGGQNNTARGPGVAIGGGSLNDASGDSSVIAGGSSNATDANATAAAIGGGTQNAVSGTGATYGTIAGGSGNKIRNDGANPTYGTIGGGLNNVVNAYAGHVGGGTGNTASGNSGVVAGGTNNTASGTRAVVGGGANNTASGGDSHVPYGQQNEATAAYSSVAGLRGKATIAGQQVLAHGYFAAAGDAQTAALVLRRSTADAAASTMSGEGTSLLVLPDNTTWAFSILIAARNVGANEHAAYEFKGLIKRDVGAATTAIVGAVTKTVIAETVAAWDANVTADTTSGDLRIRVTGEVGKTIRWVAHVRVAAVGQ